jgi:DNA replication protein DnaC
VLRDGYARNCICVRRQIQRAQLAVIPPYFGKPRLMRLKPYSHLHKDQAKVIQFVKQHPNDSYLFTGANGTGKTHICWAIYRYVLASRRPTFTTTVRDMLAAFRRMELSMKEGDLWLPRVRAVDLRKPGKPWLLFFDEFEKARPSEFAAEQLFNLLDAARSFNHQILVTSNFTAKHLRDHWGRIDQVWGNSILTRLQDCHLVEFF